MVHAGFDNEIDTVETLVYLGLAVMCVVCAALASGLTIGLMSFDTLKLKIKLRTGEEKEQAAVRRILPLLDNHHLLLCTLLLFNAIANEALPIFLDALVPSYAAVIISVTLVLLCGEVIPVALFTGPNQLLIAARLTPLVYFVRFIFFPVAYPMGKILDHMLGTSECDDVFNRDEIAAMMQIIKEERNKDPESTNDGYVPPIVENIQLPNQLMTNTDIAVPNKNGELSTNEMTVISGVLSLAKLRAVDIFIPLNRVNMLSSTQIINSEMIDIISTVGHSRLPVFRDDCPHDIVGFFLVKHLMKVNPENETPLTSLPLNEPLVVGTQDLLMDVMAVFQSGNSHLALVSDDPDSLRRTIHAGSDPVSVSTSTDFSIWIIFYRKPPARGSEPVGILTVEDILETMLQSDINDEDDAKDVIKREEASVSLREMSFSTNASRSTHANTLYDSIHKPLTSSMIPNHVQLETISPMHTNSNTSTTTNLSTNILTTVGQSDFTSHTSTNSTATVEDKEKFAVSAVLAASASSGLGSGIGSGAGSNNRSRFPMLSGLIDGENTKNALLDEGTGRRSFTWAPNSKNEPQCSDDDNLMKYGKRKSTTYRRTVTQTDIELGARNDNESSSSARTNKTTDSLTDLSIEYMRSKGLTPGLITRYSRRSLNINSNSNSDSSNGDKVESQLPTFDEEKGAEPTLMTRLLTSFSRGPSDGKPPILTPVPGSRMVTTQAAKMTATTGDPNSEL